MYVRSNTDDTDNDQDVKDHNAAYSEAGSSTITVSERMRSKINKQINSRAKKQKRSGSSIIRSAANQWCSEENLD